MRRLALPLAVATLLAVSGLLLATALVPSAEPTTGERVERIAAGLRCPDCQALSVAESRTAAAAAIRAEVEAQVLAGRSDAEVRQHFVDRYGEWILLAPSDPMVWWLPVLVLVGAAGAFAAWLFLGRQSVATDAPGGELSDAERRRIRDELESLDG